MIIERATVIFAVIVLLGCYLGVQMLNVQEIQRSYMIWAGDNATLGDTVRAQNHVTPEKEAPPVPVRYTPPPGADILEVGRPMSSDPDTLARLGIPIRNFSTLGPDTVGDFVFVTAATYNHFRECKDAIANVQEHMPMYTIYFYDLGISENQTRQVKTFCNVVYKKFDFASYPQHVSNIHTYAFKPLIIQDVLREEKNVVWMDASFRLEKNFSLFYPEILASGGFLQLCGGSRSNYAVTNPGMYEYLPTSVPRQRTVNQGQASCLYIHRDRSIYTGIVYWWVLCALTADCIAPPGSNLGCRVPVSREQAMNQSLGCHRFDQSALGLLASNYYGYNWKRYLATDGSIVSVERGSKCQLEVQLCVGL